MAVSYLLQEDGVSKIILEDGSGDLILEAGADFTGLPADTIIEVAQHEFGPYYPYSR